MRLLFDPVPVQAVCPESFYLSVFISFKNQLFSQPAIVAAKGKLLIFGLPSNAPADNIAEYRFIKKDTFNHVDKQVCTQQLEQTKMIGQNSVDLGLTDVSFRSTPTGSVVALVNGNDLKGNYLGLCYFAPVKN